MSGHRITPLEKTSRWDEWLRFAIQWEPSRSSSQVVSICFFAMLLRMDYI